ncbi:MULTISPECIES: HSP18 transcriptional regulator [unclassified Streptomyces]|uniref:HSP18 transcriptional regulator n=1 Tax=unclassified Streptomyces TaxID=2593676 RepID=UPI00224CC26C|nr:MULTISPECIES: HSP18 transcriptional regulator [unclassified Streptomyces]MCX4625185.1 HSP18 transcriptional regulator [Streptomyces sp. NBC_01443]MCX4633550.1 HSP18 transcriptional regulator [Streptomyces sp. NBC_01443]WSW49194.1 HSP18 transcriptional regulator [Streptomyces sp. NBC_01001]
MNEAAQPRAQIPFLAAAAALEVIDQAVRDAQQPPAGASTAKAAHAPDSGPHPALAALLMLREVREQLAGWESGLIETARSQGASWADLAGPLGVASRQAAERRYLRLRPGTAGSTGEQRVQATRDTRAADRTVNGWARDNAADLRRLAGQVTALTGLPASADSAVDDLNLALADNDVSRLVRPLADARPHLRPGDAELAERIDALTRHADQLRQDTHDQRSM